MRAYSVKYYRLENFEEAANICKALADGQYEAPNEDGDLRVNTAATDAQLVWSGKRDIVGDKKTPREDLDIFEGTFNAACFSIAKGEYGPAAVLLNRAKRRKPHEPFFLHTDPFQSSVRISKT